MDRFTFRIVYYLFRISDAFRSRKSKGDFKKGRKYQFFNYGEITLRMFTATGLILYADHSGYPNAFKIFGWFMFVTSIILYMVPRRLHHGFSLKCADVLKPLYFQIISPFALLFGSVIIYGAL